MTTTRFTTTLCLATLLLGAACGTDDSGNGSDDPSGDKLPLKEDIRAAREQAAEDGTPPPKCPEVWLDDGVCDHFCQEGDAADCPVVCDADDDCNGDDGDDGLVCTEIWKGCDGHCDLTDPCAPFQDADCQEDNDCDPGDGVVCIEYPQDGCCDAPAGCEGNDPDCGIFCTQEDKSPDGACNAEYCDPDCQVACAARGGDGDGEGDDPVCLLPEGCEGNTASAK
jgi:hypothetical protein